MSHSIGRRPLLAALPVAAVLTGAAHAEGDPLKAQKATFTAKNFKLVSGTVMPEVTIAYETYGTLAPDGRNAVLLTHGYTSSQHMAGRCRRERRRRLVGRAGRTRQGDRHRPALRRVVEHAGLVLRLDQSRLHQSRHRQALRAGLPRHHPGRHRQRAEGIARSVSA